MVSVLMPTRLRSERLRTSIDSLLATAAGDVEILLAVDPDDPTDYAPFERDCVIHRVAERHGYRELHEYYNLLAAAATGDWLLLYNDDCVMETERWDEIIASYPQTRVLAIDTWHKPLVTFPAIPRVFADACGHYALILHVDTWWQDLAHKLDILEWIPVRIDHQRFDHTGAEPDEVYDQRAFRLHEFYEPELQAAHDRDVETIRELIGEAEIGGNGVRSGE